jgi:hypothetical protein
MGIVSGRVGRRKTDLRPTVPSPRETTPGSVQRGKSKASPGRAYSMSRLDILAQPRRGKLAQVTTVSTQERGGEASLSRSMSTLPQGKSTQLRKGTTSRSMLQLGAPLPPPRPTRAEKLRRQAQARSHSVDQPSSPGNTLHSRYRPLHSRLLLSPTTKCHHLIFKLIISYQCAS